MEIEMAKCECCGLREECTQDYITQVKSNFQGKWLCGLCSEAVRDEVDRENNISNVCSVEDAIKAHISFCRKYKSNPAILVADGMRQMLRRRSQILSSSSSSSLSSTSSTVKKYSRSSTTSQVGNNESFLCYNITS